MNLNRIKDWEESIADRDIVQVPSHERGVFVLYCFSFFFLMFEGLWGGAVRWGWLRISFLLLFVKRFWT